MNKIYQAIANVEFHTNIKHGKEVIRISFLGGVLSPKRVNGKFSTTDEALQKSLEADSGFGKTFKLVETVKSETKSVEVDKSKFTVVEEIETVQQGKEYLMDKYPDEFQVSDLKTRATVEAAANTKELTFPNL